MYTYLVDKFIALKFTPPVVIPAPPVTYAIIDLFSGPPTEPHGRTPDTINTPGNTWAVATGSTGEFIIESGYLRNVSVSNGWGLGIDCGQTDKRVDVNVEIATSVSGTTTAMPLCREAGGSNYAGALIIRTSSTAATLRCTRRFGGGSVVNSSPIAIDGTQDNWDIVLSESSNILTAYDAASPGTTTTLDLSAWSTGSTQLPGARRIAGQMTLNTDVKYHDFKVSLL